jgi:quinol monooxygenase YgiN
MIILYVSAKTTYENRGLFQERLSSIVTLAKSSLGCLKYEWFQDHADNNHFVIYGEFDTEENFKLYKQSDVVSNIGKLLLPLLKEKPSFKHFKGQVFEQG